MSVDAVVTGQRKRLSSDRGSKSRGFPVLVRCIWTAAVDAHRAPTHLNCPDLHSSTRHTQRPHRTHYWQQRATSSL